MILYWFVKSYFFIKDSNPLPLLHGAIVPDCHMPFIHLMLFDHVLIDLCVCAQIPEYVHMLCTYTLS